MSPPPPCFTTPSTSLSLNGAPRFLKHVPGPSLPFRLMRDSSDQTTLPQGNVYVVHSFASDSDQNRKENRDYRMHRFSRVKNVFESQHFPTRLASAVHGVASSSRSWPACAQLPGQQQRTLRAP